MPASQTTSSRVKEKTRVPPTKTYEGRRHEGETLVIVNGCGVNPRLDLRNHSPTGFEWGYAGSSPAQLALAILADHLADDSAALRLYQDFKFSVIARLPRDGWTLTSEDIERGLRDLQEAGI